MDQTQQMIEEQLGKTPRLPLFHGASPVLRLSRLFPTQEVWMKDDSQLHTVCGGNKIRRLEYLLAPFKKKRKELLTFGYETSNHVLATAYFCAQVGVPCHFVLLKGPAGMCDRDQQRTAEKMRKVRTLASSVSVVHSQRGVLAKGVSKLIQGVGRIHMIPPGGSSPVGVLGSIKAIFELAHQVKRGDLPKPEFIYVPLGTGGTTVGLSIGLRSLNWNTKVIAVKIASERLNQFDRLQSLSRSVEKLLPGLSPDMTDLSNLEIETRFLGTAYGHPLPGSPLSERKWHDLEGVRLESIYSGKAALALEASLEKNKGTSLFWLTHGEFSENRGYP